MTDTELMQQALEALESCTPGDTTTGHVIWPSYDESNVEAAITALQERLAQPEQEPVAWRPIESAPKTGRKVILFYKNRLNVGRTVIARWLTDEQATEIDVDDVGLEGGWYECIDNWGDFTDVVIHEGEPSHWMPLPAPPIEALRQALETEREWVGLTADEIWKCNKASGSAVEFHICYEHQNVEDFAESIEAKLKEKNHG